MGCGVSVTRDSALAPVKSFDSDSTVSHANPTRGARPESHTKSSPGSGSRTISWDRPASSHAASKDLNNPLPLPQRAVSLQFLRRFVDELEEELGEDHVSHLSTEDVVNRFIMPRTEHLQCAYIDLPDLPRGSVGQLNYFISHAWRTPFVETVGLINNFLVGALPEDTYVWLDVFAVNQHHLRQSDKMVILQECVKVSQGMLVCLGRGPAARVVLVRSGSIEADALHKPDGDNAAGAGEQ